MLYHVIITLLLLGILANVLNNLRLLRRMRPRRGTQHRSLSGVVAAPGLPTAGDSGVGRRIIRPDGRHRGQAGG